MANRPEPEAPRAFSGILLMAVGVSLFASSDAIVKHLVGSISVFQIVALRSVFSLAVMIPALLATGLWRSCLTRRPLAHLARIVIGWIEMMCFFLSLRTVPLAEATALFFAAPLFMTALSVPLLGEKVGPRRWSAVVIGFAGVLIVLRPGTDAFVPDSLLAVAAGTFYALMMISSRWLGRSESGLSMAFSMIVGCGMISGIVAPFDWAPPTETDWYVLAALGLITAAGHLAIAEASRRAPMATLAPFEYTAMVWAVLFGFVFWRELPDRWTWTGIAVVVTSGLYVIHRELRVRRAAELTKTCDPD